MCQSAKTGHDTTAASGIIRKGWGRGQMAEEAYTGCQALYSGEREETEDNARGELVTSGWLPV